MRRTYLEIVRWTGLIGGSILWLAMSQPASAGNENFDGKWVGQGDGNLCFGVSKIEFTMTDGVLEGSWFTGPSRSNAKTETFRAELDTSGKISLYVGNVHPVKVKGTFAGDSAQGEVQSSEYHACMSFWQAKRVAGP